MWHFGHAAETMSRSRLISRPQPWLFVGYEPCTPFWLTFLKQPFAVVHAGRPYVERYTPRSASAVLSSYASTMATVWLPPAEAAAAASAYAFWRSDGRSPAGAVVANGLPLESASTNELQCAEPADTRAAQAVRIA